MACRGASTSSSLVDPQCVSVTRFFFASRRGKPATPLLIPFLIKKFNSSAFRLCIGVLLEPAQTKRILLPGRHKSSTRYLLFVFGPWPASSHISVKHTTRPAQLVLPIPQTIAQSTSYRRRLLHLPSTYTLGRRELCQACVA